MVKRLNKRGQNRSFSLNDFFIKNRRGQFFLIAAVIIIVVVVSVVTVSNYTEKKDNVKLYDLGQELGIESQNVLDYGTYSELNDSQMTTLMENFIKNYHNYAGGDKNIYFLFGNAQKINVIGYQDISEEAVCVKLNPSTNTECAAYTAVGSTQPFIPATGDINKIAIDIGNNEYQFSLKRGENFYFVIWQLIGGETHVVTS
jgi:hypothetical protein